MCVLILIFDQGIIIRMIDNQCLYQSNSFKRDQYQGAIFKQVVDLIKDCYQFRERSVRLPSFFHGTKERLSGHDAPAAYRCTQKAQLLSGFFTYLNVKSFLLYINRICIDRKHIMPANVRVGTFAGITTFSGNYPQSSISFVYTLTKDQYWL